MRRVATSRTAVVVGACEGAVGVAVLTVGSLAHMGSGTGDATMVLTITLLLVGFIVAYRVPTNPMGWLLLGAAGFLLLSGVGGSYSVLDYRVHHGALPLAPIAVLLDPSWAPALLLFVLGILLYPEGHLPRRRWRWPMAGLLLVAAAWQLGAYGIAGSTILSGHIDVTASGDLWQVDNPSGAWAWWGTVQSLFFLTVTLTFVSWVVSQTIGYRRLSGERRLQQKWLLGGAAIGIGVLRFRLYEIDRLMSRTLAYAIMTAILVGVFVGLVELTTQLLPFSSTVGVAASTLTAAALFNPVRVRVQRAVDRRFNRTRYDAQQTVDAFAAQLRDAVDVDTVQADLLTAVKAAVQPAHATVWLGPGGVR